ncbi:MAG: Hsp20/alpha crystallin family protein [Bacteroidetes bacterium]|nr:Hsp20/alpha crystallin family protein [Bacteroidota bacterium]
MHTFEEHNPNEEILFGRPVDDFLGDSVPVFTEYHVEDEELAYRIEISVPGFTRKELRLLLKDDLLILMAFRLHHEKGFIFKSTYREIVLKRSFVCPHNIAVNTVRAKYENGVLHINLPKQLISYNSKLTFLRKDRIVRIKGEGFSFKKLFHSLTRLKLK